MMKIIMTEIMIMMSRCECDDDYVTGPVVSLVMAAFNCRTCLVISGLLLDDKDNDDINTYDDVTVMTMMSPDLWPA